MPTPDPREFGKQIARLRKARGLSQVDLADASGVPITAIRRCEQNGRIPLDRYLILATALNASLKIAQSTPADGSIPDRLPYKSIHDIIREAAQRPPTQAASENRRHSKKDRGPLRRPDERHPPDGIQMRDSSEKPIGKIW